MRLVLQFVARLGLVALMYLFLYRVAVLAGILSPSSLRERRGGHATPELPESEDSLQKPGELEVETGPGVPSAGERFSLGICTTLGRAQGSDVVIRDPYVSARHAEVVRAGTRYKLRDLGSSNGTYVNGRKIPGERVLRPGDRVRLGDTVLRFRG